MPRGGILTLGTQELTIDETYLTSHPEAIPGRYVALEVSDTGEGIDRTVMEHVFEPFFTTKETGKGTGLGLSTVYGIVKQHLGFVNVYSEPGKGTSFRIYLPRSGAEPEIQEEDIKRKIVQEESDGNETVVIVEDNDLVRDLTGEILRKSGYMIISANNGKECLTALADYDDKIDLLLTDVIMPDMNGRELYEELLRSRPGLPVIYMSGYTEDAIAYQGVLEKGTNLIHKPFTRKVLTEMVREVLNRSSS
jgi:two-component system, cell cycle sensor histidine kinase and response regulator CckA